MSFRSRLAALAVTAVMASAATHLVGCIGCGVGPSPDQADVVNGVVTFPSVAVGSSQTVAVTFQDSANTSETVMAATISGADAADFEVVSDFPLAIPAGDQVTVDIQFSPTATGSASATLDLQTAKMGISPVQLDGTGIASGG